ncbi:TonB-dependent receptor [Piscinibacter sp. XHJ-5]|uniref:TonB-dependent receptor n=1 Tax=Piscinibacter sp. XHJ-5 TaxID=3037797 RepID=UPI00245324C6|nr:TonB-dependent receptor [Piscinibacter sp. XHJ-5]
MFRKTKVCTGLALAFGGSLALSVAPALAQQSLERVEITGSNIKRTDTETSSPVQVISKQEIDQSGKGTVAEYLQTLTADAQGSVPFTYGRGFSGATASGISLRGLGANATLVLINGRRVTTAVLADDAQRAFTDLNAIPLEAVERVEVLKDGASSIYGSDAVAGVVNIILRKNFTGTVAKASYGVSQEGDGNEARAAITHGFGDMQKDGYNALLNFEAGKKDPIWYRDRMGRGTVGVSAIGNPVYGFGFDPDAASNNLARTGGNGWIPPAANQTTQSIIGNVRDPATNVYHSRGEFFPAAQAYCNATANLPQNNPGGGCVTDIWQQVGQIQPKHDTYNLFGRFNKQINPNLEAFAELSYYHTESVVSNTGSTPSTAVNTPSGIPQSQTATTLLGAGHPDNPYAGAARLSYNPSLEPGVGPNIIESKSHTSRAVVGLKGTLAAWDFDTGLFFSESKQTDVFKKRMNVLVKNALLNPTPTNVDAAVAASPAYAALIAANPGTVWRIGENAHLNSQAMYDALLQDQSREGFSRQYGADIKVSRELGKLEGGPIGVAVGAEVRHEANNLPFYTGLGEYIGLSLTKYGGEHDIYAAYVEGLFPVTKRLELNAALRFDHYSDAGNSTTPKVGAKFKAMDNLAFRGTYAQGFRAPSSAENSANSLAAFSGATVNDPLRCASAGPALAPSNCVGVAPTYLQTGNPDLEPEKSKSTTLGLVWDITPKTSLTADLWQIKRTGLPVIEDTQAAVDAGRYVRDPAQAINATDPGPILIAFVRFVNSAQSLTRGLDVEGKHRFDLGDAGKLTAGLTWTHLLKQRVIDADGTVHDYAGTHGNCEITNCIGSPKDRVQVTTTWERGPVRLGANLNYRGSFKGIDEEGAPCWADDIALPGVSTPGGCKVKSFYTVDLSGVYAFNAKAEIFGSIQNLFDKKPPFDPETYGAIGYNPLDYSGAIGRYFRVGFKYKF